MKKISIAHIIHPVIVGKESDLVMAQPITFKTMDVAKKFASEYGIDVNLYAIQYFDEKRIELPESFIRTKDLTRSTLNMNGFRKKRKLAFIKDIISGLYHSSNSDYLIYTNVDIALLPYFYTFVYKIINSGYDSFIINRRTIPGSYKNIEEIPLMFSEIGEKHPGWDCFVFKRDLYPKFDLGEGIIGQGWIGRILMSNFILFSEKFKVFEDRHLTFHIGNDRVWKNNDFRDYQEHNIRQCKRFLKEYELKNEKLDRNKKPGQFFNLEKNII